MALTLTANISATDRSIGVTGMVPDSIGQGYRFRLDDELLEVRGFEYVNVQYPVYRQDDPDRNAWLVNRAVDGIAASHTAGASILGAIDAYVASESSTTAPEPFASGGGGSGDSFPDAWTVGEDGSLIVDNRHGVAGGFDPENPSLAPIFKVTPDQGEGADSEVWASTLRVYNRLIVDDAPVVAKNDDGNTFFELDPSANAGAGAVKVHGAELTEGAPGASFLAEAHAPDDTNDGIDGDSYLDTSTGDFYGPKDGGAWGASTASLADIIEAVVPDTPYDDIADDATLVQGSGTATLAACDVRIKRLGREVHARIYVLAGSVTGETGEPWVLTMPAAFPAAENAQQLDGPYVAGCGYVAAGGVPFPVTVTWDGAVEGARGLKMIGPSGEVGTDPGGMALQLLDGAELQFNLVYEAAEAAA